MHAESAMKLHSTCFTRTDSPELPRFHVKDPISALTHFIGFWAAILAMPLLLIRAAARGHNLIELFSLGIFMLSMVLLYGASSAYHSFNLSVKANLTLKKVDHCMIFLLIAGSYTPPCLIVLPRASGLRLLALVWGIGLAGILFKLFWVTCPKWVSSVIYIVMGWLCLTAFPEIHRLLAPVPFFWLLCGGIIYTIGGIIYALKLPLLEKRFPGFGAHELFHLFVMGGSFCHFICMLLLAA